MRDACAILALRRKRACLAGEIAQAERQPADKCEVLATLNATIQPFEPTANPEPIPAIRPTRRKLFFRQGEQMRLRLAALRQAAGRCGSAGCRVGHAGGADHQRAGCAVGGTGGVKPGVHGRAQRGSSLSLRFPFPLFGQSLKAICDLMQTAHDGRRSGGPSHAPILRRLCTKLGNGPFGE